MTYAGLKSMIYAGLTKDDPRVKAAMEWIGKNWTLDENPGMQYADPSDPASAQSGLYYYYHTLARALRLRRAGHYRCPGEQARLARRADRQDRLRAASRRQLRRHAKVDGKQARPRHRLRSTGTGAGAR